MHTSAKFKGHTVKELPSQAGNSIYTPYTVWVKLKMIEKPLGFNAKSHVQTLCQAYGLHSSTTETAISFCHHT